MNYKDLKIGQKVFFVSAIEEDPKIEEVFITEINSNNTFLIERNGADICCVIENDSDIFNFAYSDEKEPKNYGTLYLNLELVMQEKEFNDIIYNNTIEIQGLNIEDKIKLTKFIENLLKKPE